MEYHWGVLFYIHTREYDIMTKFLVKQDDGLKKVMHFLSNINLKKPWSVEIKPYVKNRSVEQNALMWKWHVLMADHFGLTKNKTHHVIMEELLAPIQWNYEGKNYEVYSTKVMNTKQMTDFLKMYHIWAATDHGVNLPLPEDMHAR